ncbi:MAG: class I SAM-dependent methyltransferase [Bacteriovorax sp.]|nr:class I SAM-dependent methyltransferase [Bacteriovorax sp.]
MKDLQQIVIQNLLKTKESSRIFHGRGRLWAGFEHVVIDYFSPHLLITIYKEKESEAEFIKELVQSLKEIPDLVIENILLQKRYLSRPELIAVEGSIPTIAEALERGSKFNLKFGDTQNIGFFLDMSPGREMLERISQNKKVLNLFSYTCSLSVAALKGEASGVVNIDMSKAALSVGESNHLLNKLDMNKVRFLPYDIMKSWNKIFKFGPYDIVVIDPPTNQGDSFKVERDYYKIVKRLNEMTNNEAVIMACLNSPHLTSQFLIDLFKEHAPEFKFEEIIYSAFNSMETNPEEGLKIVVFKKLTCQE